jgi:hypothetical protein
MALFNIGAYYILAAVNDLKSFYNSAAVKAELDEV